MALFTAGLAALTAITSTVGTAASALGGIAAASAGGVGAATAAGLAGGAAATGAATAGAATIGAGLTASAAAGAGGLGALGTALGAAGTVASIGGTVASSLQAQEAAAAQRRAEELRERQMRLNAQRDRREIIRAAMINRALGLNAQAGSGAEVAGSSAYGGLIGGNTTAAQNSLLASRQNEYIGSGIFQANADASRAEANSRTFGSAAGLGNLVSDNNMQLARIATGATSLFSRT